MEGALEGAHRISLFAGDHDDSAASWHLEDVVAVVGHRHELGQGWIPEDGIVRQTDVGDVEVDELGAVVVALPEGGRKADLPYRCAGAISHSSKGLGGLMLIMWHLKVVERLDGQDVEPCAAVDEGLGDPHIADD